MGFPEDISFHLFSSCIPVKGIARSIIYDLQRNKFEYIPNSLYNILINNKNISFLDLIKKFKNEDVLVIRDYFDFLVENEFIFFSNLDNNLFPKYNISYSKPHNISYLVIDVDKDLLDDFEKIKKEINISKIGNISFRFIDPIKFDIEKTIEFFNDIPVRNILIFINDKNEIFDECFFENLINVNKRISKIIKYNSDEDSVKLIKNGVLASTKRNVIESKMKINNISDFDINLDLFMESNLYNNFFYKRMYINNKGNIKRYEHDKYNFGNIKDTALLDVLENNKFKEFWNINKDIIEECSNCEYKYMCVDSRLPLFKTNNIWKLEGECDYNPHEAKWKID